MRSVIKNKKGMSVTGYVLTLVIVVVLIIAITLSMTRMRVLDKLRIFIPFLGGSNVIEDQSIITCSNGCPVAVAVMGDDGTYSFCKNPKDSECRDTYSPPSSLYFDDGVIRVRGSAIFTNYAVGNVFRGQVLLYPEIVKQMGSVDRPDLYYTLLNKGRLPSNLFLRNFDGACYNSKKVLCRESQISYEDVRKTVATRSFSVAGDVNIYYFDMDSLILNNNVNTIPVYEDSQMTKVSTKYVLSSDRTARRISDSEELAIRGGSVFINNIRTNIKSSSTFDSNWKSQVNKESDSYSLINPIDNLNNKLGVDSGGDNFEEVSFVFSPVSGEVYGESCSAGKCRVFISFGTGPWIMEDYWNAYGSFAGAPSWAIKDSNLGEIKKLRSDFTGTIERGDSDASYPIM